MISKSRNPTLKLLVVANVLLLVAILTFAVGFFPHKPFLPGISTKIDGYEDGSQDPPFGKIVFMVVDALRR